MDNILLIIGIILLISLFSIRVSNRLDIPLLIMVYLIYLKLLLKINLLTKLFQLLVKYCPLTPPYYLS